MTKIKDLHSGWRRDGEYRAAYDGLDEEFRLARALIEARTVAGAAGEANEDVAVPPSDHLRA